MWLSDDNNVGNLIIWYWIYVLCVLYFIDIIVLAADINGWLYWYNDIVYWAMILCSINVWYDDDDND